MTPTWGRNSTVPIIKATWAAVYILDANKYMMNSSGKFIWKEDQQRALERAAVWMRHYRNHPSVVMWIAGCEFLQQRG